MEAIFTDNEYETPAGKKVIALSKIQLVRNIFFYWLMARTVLRAESLAKKGAYDYEAWAKSSFDTIGNAESCGAKLEIKGLKNVKTSDDAVVFIGNHMSVFETFAVACMLIPYRKPAFVIKRELLEYPFFGKVVRSLVYISVGRKNSKDDFKDVMEQGCKLISNGYSPVIFPQAARMRDFIPERFNTIGVKLAKKAGVPIVPFALRTDFWETGKIIKDFGPIGKRGNKIYFEFSNPMKVSGTGKEEHEKIIRFIQAKLDKWKGE